MKCPACSKTATRIVDSRASEAGISRRRECRSCHDRFSTFEQVQFAAIMVIKRDGRREEFQSEKLRHSLHLCARKLPLPEGTIDAIVEDIERRLAAADRGEVPSRLIGEMAINHLRRVDPIAYIRFAASYRPFVSVDDMLNDLTRQAYNPLPAVDQPRLFEDEFDRLLSGGDEPPEAPEPDGDGSLPAVPTPITSAPSASRG
jgi:transcriptional repressor NrdR